MAEETLDQFTRDLLERLSEPAAAGEPASEDFKAELAELVSRAGEDKRTEPILDIFRKLSRAREEKGLTPDDLGLSRQTLADLARRHAEIDEHEVSVGGRLGRAEAIVAQADLRVQDYLSRHAAEAPSGLELWDLIEENGARIRRALGMTDADWSSYSGQLRHRIDTVDQLASVLDLPAEAVDEVRRVTGSYRMRLTPYYASLIRPGRPDDPVLLQSVPTAEMTDNVGREIPPVAADHSPARLVDQFYPRVVSIKATNMCAMYCTHCLRIAHIGSRDNLYSKEAYGEALDYVRKNSLIRDVLITGGDALVLPNDVLRWLLSELDAIDHVRLKRLGSRIPVTAPMRVDEELLDILGASNEKKPLRVVTQINTAQEITPLSRRAFRNLSQRAAAVLNQAVLLRGINDSRIKMWKLCETIQEGYVRPYYVFNCSFRNPQFKHLRVPVEKGRDIIESMYGNISGDAIPRYIATAGGKVPLHRDNTAGRRDGGVALIKPWSGEEVVYPDADPEEYGRENFGFARYEW